ncbi:MAG: hypothetical protein E7271_08715 [Lachnospiraceae bacterium]|jgi:hypothetical protein|nr:hypothetical protein [Lachnospiraceae bacterium]
MRKSNKKSFAAFALAAVMAASVLPAIPASASTVQVSEQSSYGALASAPSISLAETTVGAQSSISWKFNYSPVIGETTYKIPAYKDYDCKSEYNNDLGKYVWSVTEKDVAESAEKKYSPDMEVLVFDKNDVNHEKPEYGTTAKQASTGKYYVTSGGTSKYYVDPEKNPNYKYEFTIDSDNLSPGDKQVIAYYFDEPGYQVAKKIAEVADDKAHNEALVAYRNQREDEYKAAYDAWIAGGSVGEGPVKDVYNGGPVKSDFTANVDALNRGDFDVASAPVAIKVDSEGYALTTVTSNSVKFSFRSTSRATGFELERKVGKKFVKIASVSSGTYTDKGLVSSMTYTYRVRPYYINPTTKVTTYGKYNEMQATTKGSALKFQATVTSKNKVKLTWSKVNGVSYYEIYRSDTASQVATTSKGLGDAYASFKKIKTLKKGKKTWTDKSVKANHAYEYMIVAVLKKGKTKGDSPLQITDSSYAALTFGSIDEKTSYVNANGDKTITWEKMYGAAGYKIERYDYNMTTKTWDWTPVATLGKNATKYTFKASAYFYYTDAEAQAADKKTFKKDVTYRITPYKSASVLGESKEYEVSYKAGIVKKVTAKVDKTAKGIKVSWDKVPNASYYKVYREMSNTHVNNKDIGGYGLDGGTEVVEYVGATDPVKVDVAAYNANIDASIAAYEDASKDEQKKYQDAYNQKAKEYLQARQDYTDGKRATQPTLGEFAVNPADYFKTDSNDYYTKYDKLKTYNEYYYQNYSYARDVFDANTTSIIDYYGDVIYSGTPSGKTTSREYVATLRDYYKDKTYPYYENAYSGYWDDVTNNTLGADGKVTVGFTTSYNPIVVADKGVKLGEQNRPMAGVSYDYYVVAYIGTEKVATDYEAYGSESYGYVTTTKDGVTTKEPSMFTYKGAPDENTKAPISDDSIIKGQRGVVAFNTATAGTNIDSTTKKKTQYAQAEQVIVIDDVDFKWTTKTYGVKSYGTASYSTVTPAKKPTLKSVKATKGKVTITIKKKVAGASYYKIYRATKKKGKYHSVGVTSNGKTTKFVDKSAVKGKTYFYKVVTVVRNEAYGDVESTASAVKKVKAK